MKRLTYLFHEPRYSILLKSLRFFLHTDTPSFFSHAFALKDSPMLVLPNLSRFSSLSQSLRKPKNLDTPRIPCVRQPIPSRTPRDARHHGTRIQTPHILACARTRDFDTLVSTVFVGPVGADNVGAVEGEGEGVEGCCVAGEGVGAGPGVGVPEGEEGVAAAGGEMVA